MIRKILYLLAILLLAIEGIYAELPDKPLNGSKIPDITTFMQIGFASSPIISPDGKTIYYFNNFTSTSQIFKIDVDYPYPYQLTFAKEGAKYPSLSPNGKWIVYLSDKGGNEQYQLYLLNTKYGFWKRLTHRDDVRYGYAIWSSDSKKIYFRGNGENPRYFSIYEMDISCGKIRTVINDKGYFGPSDISKDGKKLLYYQYLSNRDSNIYIYNFDTKTKTLITPHKGEVKNIPIVFSPRGRYIYYLTDDTPAGVLKLACFDTKTQRRNFLGDYKSVWEVEDATLSPNRHIIALLRNHQGYGIIKLYDLQNKRYLPSPKFKGIASSVSFSKGSKIAFTLNRPTRASEIYTWDWNTLEMRKITSVSYAGINPKLFVEPELIHYKSFDGLEIPAFLYLPPNWKKNMGHIPFIIHFHGGPEGQFRPYFQRHFNYFLLHGYGILAPNIRGSSGYGKKYENLDNYKKRMDSVKDGYYAALYLIKKGYTQKGLIGLKGGSYGGFMVMALLTEYPDMWGAAYESIGIVNFVNFLKNTKPYRRKLREAEYGPLSDEKFLRKISPIYKIDRVKTPLLISHGVNDPRVPVSEAKMIIKSLKKRGVVVKALLWKDEGHGVQKKENRLKLYKEMADFFNKYLKKE